MENENKQLECKRFEKKVELLAASLRATYPAITWEKVIVEDKTGRIEFTAEWEDSLVINDESFSLAQMKEKLLTKLKLYHPNFDLTLKKDSI